ncbi:hypothetical protein [Reichenbachiella ulvae]|uniref:Uncharacterized protein n=1 Tax=Reichenbachiella ulvae TaxID=2980104 RepID=A0ABT3D0Y4_9BACT|nr:hypothetical protein [Reichenbachiella ulvae]MCV9389491.1 hypothetical protein [Reichenbachiella ulvae]
MDRDQMLAAHFVALIWTKTLAGRMDDLPTMEPDRTENALRDEVTKHELLIEKGILHVPDTSWLRRGSV